MSDKIKMDNKVEQGAIIKYLVKGKTPPEVLDELVEVYGDNAYSQTSVYMWCNRYLNGWDSVIIKKPSGPPKNVRTDINIERVNTLIRSNRRLTLVEMASELNIGRTTIHQILTKDLNMNRVSAQYVPRILTEQQKTLRLEKSQNNINSFENDNRFLSKIITGTVQSNVKCFIFNCN